MQPISYARHLFPAEIIRHADWLDLRITLRSRDVKEPVTELTVEISDGTVRRRVLRFGPMFARNLCWLCPESTGTWHSDERVGCTGGAPVSLWRTLDREGEVLDRLISTRRTRHRDKHLGGRMNAVSDLYQGHVRPSILIPNPRPVRACSYVAR